MGSHRQRRRHGDESPVFACAVCLHLQELLSSAEGSNVSPLVLAAVDEAYSLVLREEGIWTGEDAGSSILAICNALAQSCSPLIAGTAFEVEPWVEDDEMRFPLYGWKWFIGKSAMDRSPRKNFGPHDQDKVVFLEFTEGSRKMTLWMIRNRSAVSLAVKSFTELSAARLDRFLRNARWNVDGDSFSVMPTTVGHR